jgi:hypothetical protein
MVSILRCILSMQDVLSGGAEGLYVSWVFVEKEIKNT